MTTVAVIGLGAMGSRIARRLLDTDHELLVWNRTAAKTEPLVAAGAASAASPADAAGRADAVITMLADPDALRAVAEVPDGIAAGATAGTTVIEMSTVGPAAVRWLASALPDDVGLIDAPVLGSLKEAESGSLKVFIGGPDELVERWTSLLSTLGSPMHMGPLGLGASAKLVANATLVGTLTLLGEVVALSDRLGVPRERAFEVLEATPLAAQAGRRRRALETREFPRNFGLSLARKDAELVVEAADEHGLRTPVLEAARRWFTEADAASWGDRDYSEVLRWIFGERETP
jgi:3-hydroxyisobutyrate dehydrogenase-like beta-hydroxyacid dehydrogenase